MIPQTRILKSALAVWRQTEASCYGCDQPAPIVGALAVFSEHDPGGLSVAPICARCMIRVKNSSRQRRRMGSNLGREVALREAAR